MLKITTPNNNLTQINLLLDHKLQRIHMYIHLLIPRGNRNQKLTSLPPTILNHLPQQRLLLKFYHQHLLQLGLRLHRYPEHPLLMRNIDQSQLLLNFGDFDQYRYG